MKRIWMAGALVSFLVGCTDYHIIKTPLGEEAQYTSNSERTYIVAGCVPKNLPLPTFPLGSVWVLCNDLDYVKDKVVESSFVSCLDLMGNGVVKSLEITEVSNRKWKSFRFVCAPMQRDGTLGSPTQHSPLLFDFTQSGTDFSTMIANDMLPLGFLEIYNQLQFRESLLRVGIIHQSADATYQNGQNNTWPANPNVSPRIPDASPMIIGVATWQCPPGMVITGAAIGHIPEKNDKWTRPVYLLGECRKLHKFAIL